METTNFPLHQVYSYEEIEIDDSDDQEVENESDDDFIDDEVEIDSKNYFVNGMPTEKTYSNLHLSGPSRTYSFPILIPDVTSKKVFCSLFNSAISGLLLGMVAGGLIAVIGLVTVIPALLIGGVIGMTILVALWFFKSSISKEDLAVLLSDATPFGIEHSNNARIIKEIILSQEVSPSDVYFLHYSINAILNEVKKDPLKLTPFTTFLKGMDGLVVKYPNERKVTLDFSRELRRLNGLETIVKVEPLDKAALTDQDIKELVQIGKEAFLSEYDDEEKFRALISSATSIYVARDENNNREIIGYLFLEKKENIVHISLMARRANASGIVGVFDSQLSEFERIARMDWDAKSAWIQAQMTTNRDGNTPPPIVEKPIKKLSIGEQLYNAAQTDGIFTDAEEIRARISNDNDSAKSFFERLGFKAGMIDDSLVMVLSDDI